MSCKSKILIALSMLAVLILSAGGFSQEPAAPPDELIFGGKWEDPENIVIPTDQVVFHQESLGNYENEGNFYMSRFNDGWIVMVQLFVWKYLSMRGWGIYALTVSPDGKRYFAKHQLNEKAVQVGKDHLFVKEGKNSVEGKDGVYRVKFDIENFKCDLTYKNNVREWRPGDGYAWYSKKDNIFQFSLVTCPWADVTGTITLPDRTLKVNGEGYSDRSRATLFPTKLAPYLYSIRVFSPTGTPREERWMFGLLEQQMHPSFGGKRVPFIHLCHNNKIVMATKNYQIIPSDWAPGKDTPYKYPRRIKIRAKDKGWSLDGEYVCGELFDFLDVLAELPLWIRKMAEKFVKRPVYFRSHGQFNAVVISPDGKKTQLNLIGPHEYVVTK